MSKLSRRALVTSAATLPALAVPAFAADVIGPNHPDAELLRLGAELDHIIAEWHAQRAIDKANCDLRDAACETAGLSDIEFGTMPDDEWLAYKEKRLAVRRACVNSGDDVNVWDDIHGRMWPMIDAIIERKAQTLAGFAVQARAISLSYSELWDGGEGEGNHYRPFIEAACAFAGVVPVPLDNAAPVAAISPPAPDPIFAVIEKHRRLEGAFHAPWIMKATLKNRGHLVTAPDDFRTPEMVAIQAASEAARAELASTAPTTSAGLTALLDYVVANSSDDFFLLEGEDEMHSFVRSLARGAKQIARGAVQS